MNKNEIPESMKQIIQWREIIKYLEYKNRENEIKRERRRFYQELVFGQPVWKDRYSIGE